MKIKRFLGYLIGLAFLIQAVFGYCANTADQIVSFTINPILEISVSGNPSTLIITAIDPQYPSGEYDLLPVEDNTTYYNITATVPFQITGRLQDDMVQGAWIFVKLTEPSEGYSLGFVQLNDNYGEKLPAQTLLTSDPTSTSNLTITYRFAADVNAGTRTGVNTLILTVLEI